MTANAGNYLREVYNVPACLNGRVAVDGKPGTIASFDTEGVYLWVRFDDETEPAKVHPTWRVEYLDAAEVQA